MALKILEEKHKRAAEMMLQGVPRKTIAATVNVAPATLYDWLKDGLFTAYAVELKEEMMAARRARLTPVTMKLADLLENVIAKTQALLAEGALENPISTIDVLTKALRTLVETERNDSDPTVIGARGARARGTLPQDAPAGPRGEVQNLLDELKAGGRVTPVGPKATH